MREILLAVRIEGLSEGGFLVTSDELPGLLAQGRTIAEALEIAQDGAQKLIESYHEHGDPLPPALREVATRNRKVAVKIRIPIAIS